MSNKLSWLAVPFALIAPGVLLALAFVYLLSTPHDLSLPTKLSQPYVKIIKPTGHGSATHLGRGYFLTAAHVTKNATELTVLDDLGRRIPVAVVLRDDATDIAIVRAYNVPPIRAARTQCREPMVGEQITANGNPLDGEFINTWGRVSKAPAKVWILQSAFVVVLTVMPGMSGAGIRDAGNYIIGVISATMRQNGVNIALVMAIPAAAFCPLLKQAGAI